MLVFGGVPWGGFWLVMKRWRFWLLLQLGAQIRGHRCVFGHHVLRAKHLDCTWDDDQCLKMEFCLVWYTQVVESLKISICTVFTQIYITSICIYIHICQKYIIDIIGQLYCGPILISLHMIWFDAREDLLLTSISFAVKYQARTQLWHRSLIRIPLSSPKIMLFLLFSLYTPENLTWNPIIGGLGWCFSCSKGEFSGPHWVSPREPKTVEFSRCWRYLPSKVTKNWGLNPNFPAFFHEPQPCLCWDFVFNPPKSNKINTSTSETFCGLPGSLLPATLKNYHLGALLFIWCCFNMWGPNFEKYPPGNGYISHQTRSSENHQLKRLPVG